MIALGMGLGLLIVRRLRPDAPEQAQNVIAISGAFASFAMVFNNPVIAAIILVEAIGIGGAMAPVIILPGLMAAGIGGLVYLGLGSLTGLDTSTYALKPLDLQPLANLTLADFGWAIVAAVVATLVAVAVVRGGRHVAGLVKRNYLLLVPIVGVMVAVLALIFTQSTGQPSYAILFSGSRAMSPIVAQAGTLSVATLLLLVLLKGVAWSLSMGSFRGGPVFPAIFLGLAGGLLASRPGFGASAAVPAVMAAVVVSVLRLPLAAAVITMLLTGSTGLESAPLVVLGLVIGYVLSVRLYAVGSDKSEAAAAGGNPR